MLPDFVQGKQPVILHIGDECTVGKDTFVDMCIFGIGLKKGLSGSFVDCLHDNTLYGCCGDIGRQHHKLFQE